MKLYLSSFDIGNFPERLMELFSSSNPQIGIVMNALDNLPDARNKWLLNNKSNLGKLGFRVDELDLRNFFLHKMTPNDLSRFDGLWVNGGNSFILQRAFHESGLNQVLPKMVIEEKIVYSGFSAALCVVSASLHGFELVDDPINIPEGYNQEFTWDGLSFLEKPIAVHYKSDHSESEAIDKEIE